MYIQYCVAFVKGWNLHTYTIIVIVIGIVLLLLLDERKFCLRSSSQYTKILNQLNS